MCEIAEEIGIPFAPVAKTEDLFDDPQLNAEGRMCETVLPNGEMVKLPRIPVEVGDHQFDCATNRLKLVSIRVRSSWSLVMTKTL